MTNYYEKVKQFIDMNPQLRMQGFGIPASEEMVARLEQELNVKFRGEYLQFIREWGSISLAGCFIEFFAIYPFKGRIINWVMDEAKYCWEKGLDRKLIPIATIDGDEFYCLDPSIDGDQAIYRWEPHFNEILGKLSDSLFELIWREIEEEVIPNSRENGDPVYL